MRKLMLGVVLGGLLLAVTGCGGGGGGSSSGGGNGTIPTAAPTPWIYPLTTGLQPINMYYQAQNAGGTDTYIMAITGIEVKSSSLIVHCFWSVTNKSGKKIVKLSDEGDTTFYMLDNKNKTYNHYAGTGAAYAQAELSSIPVTGTFTFPALQSGVTSFSFKDSMYSQTIGPIEIK